MSLVIEVLFFSTLSFVVPCWKTIYRETLYHEYVFKGGCNQNSSRTLLKTLYNRLTSNNFNGIPLSTWEKSSLK